MTLFVDGVILTQKHLEARSLAGIRTLSYREAGDINREGVAVEEQEVISDQARWAWIQGSHQTAIRCMSQDGLVAMAGNPGRWGEPDNLFGPDLPGTIAKANTILDTQGLPHFVPGQVYDMDEGGNAKWNGARVWTIHLTQNYCTGSMDDAQAVINWLDTQSIARVKKSRLGASTVVWGSLKYCQVEAYLKAPEMLAHAKSDEERESIKASPAYKWASENGVVRIEVKAAKEYLRHKALTHLGDWNMGTVHRIYQERTEVLNRCKLEVEEFDPAMLPANFSKTAALWLRGEDVRRFFKNRMTLYRHAKALREYGIDITQPRNIETFPVRIRTIDMQPSAIPDWYRRAA